MNATLYFGSDLQLVFEEARVGHSVVDLRQQTFHVLHRDAGTRHKRGKVQRKHSARKRTRRWRSLLQSAKVNGRIRTFAGGERGLRG